MKAQRSRRSDGDSAGAVRGLVTSTPGPAGWVPPAGGDGDLRVPVDEAGELRGKLEVPAGATGVVLLARGHGSSRQSPRDATIARLLRAEGLGTLLMDLLTPEEEKALRQRELRFNVGLFSGRVSRVARWLRQHPRTRGLKVGYLGSYTGAGAVLAAAAHRPDQVDVIVCRGGRLGVSPSVLARVRTPTLLIVGSRDAAALEPHRRAMAALGGVKKLEVVSGAGHRFEESGTQTRMVDLAGHWFLQHMGVPDWHPLAVGE